METNSEDEEWQYIYDELETETITFTIDLSATPAGPGTANVDSAADESEIPAGNGTIGLPETQAAPIAPVKSSKLSSVQFLDLSSSQPYISYKGQVFTGSWGQTIGSDLVFAAAADVPPEVEPVIEDRLGRWALLGVSQTTLIAKPIELIKRIRLGLPAAMGDATSQKIAKPFSVKLKADTDYAVRKQAEYLEQLQAIKIARGETDVVYFGKNIEYSDASGKIKKIPVMNKKDERFLAHGIIKRMNGSIVDEDDEVDSDEHGDALQEEDDEGVSDDGAGKDGAGEQESFPRSTPSTFDISANSRKVRMAQGEITTEPEQRPTKKLKKDRVLRARVGGGGLFRDFDGNPLATKLLSEGSPNINTSKP